MRKRHEVPSIAVKNWCERMVESRAERTKNRRNKFPFQRKFRRNAQVQITRSQSQRCAEWALDPSPFSLWHPMQIVLDGLYAAPGQLLRSVWPSTMYIDPGFGPTHTQPKAVSRVHGCWGCVASLRSCEHLQTRLQPPPQGWADGGLACSQGGGGRCNAVPPIGRARRHAIGARSTRAMAPENPDRTSAVAEILRPRLFGSGPRLTVDGCERSGYERGDASPDTAGARQDPSGHILGWWGNRPYSPQRGAFAQLAACIRQDKTRPR
jgi:hypothetical protein